MMVINCSAAAAAHLYGKYKKGKDEGVFEPSSSVTETLMERQIRSGPQGVIQWVVHAVKIGRSVCLIAMEVQTRWVHVIHQVRKGDVNDFVERLNGRLINGIEWLGADFFLFSTAQMEAAIERYFSQHREIRFYQQTDPSVLAHIAQVSDLYQRAYYDVGAFPEDEETATEVDLGLNTDWRCRKGEAFGLKVDEKMLKVWMTDYVGCDASEVSEKVSSVKEVRRAMRMAEQQEIVDTLSGQQGPADNVIDFSGFRAKR